MTEREDFRAAAARTLKAFASRLKSAGAGVPQMLVAYAFALARPREIVLAGAREVPAMPAMLSTIRRSFLPNAVVMMAGESFGAIPAHVGRPSAYASATYASQQTVHVES